MDLSILWFFLLTVVNVALIGFVIYRWGLFSAEGYCMGLLLLLVASDAVSLYWCYFFNPEELRLGIGEFEFRIYPTVIHIIGIFSFICGLYVSNRNPVPIIRPITPKTQPRLKMNAVTTTLIGLIMYLIALYLIGGFGATDFYSNLNQYRTDNLAYGGFWYRGSDIMLLGLSMLLMAIRRGWIARSIILLLIAVAPLALESNKGGLQKSIIYLAFCAYIFRPTLFRRFLKPSIMVPVFAALLLTLGVKNIATRLAVANKSGTVSVTDYSLTDLSHVVSQSLAGRYSYEGIYRGYCKMANYLHDGNAPLFGGKVLLYTFDSWIPRMVWPNKPEHPFHGTGYMISVNGENNEKEASAFSFVGYALADYGPWGVAPILFAGGIFLGLFRRFTTGRDKSIQWVLLYVFFVIFGGASQEAGFLGILSSTFLVLIPLLPSYAIVSLLTRRRPKAFHLRRPEAFFLPPMPQRTRPVRAV